MSDYPMLISNKLHSFRNFGQQRYKILFIQYVKEHLILTFYTTSQKEENGDTIDFLVSLFSTISDSSSPFPEVNRNHNRTTYLVSSR